MEEGHQGVTDRKGRHLKINPFVMKTEAEQF